jgi:hypothetical protein
MQQRIKAKYENAHISYCLHMKEMWGVLTRFHEEEIDVNLVGEIDE